MSQELLVKFDVDTKDAQKGIVQTSNALKGVAEQQDKIAKGNQENQSRLKKGMDNLTGATKKATGQFKVLFKALKGAAVFAVIFKAIQKLGEAFSANQVVADKFAAIFGTINSVLTQVATATVNTFQAVNEATGGFERTTAVVKGLITIALTPLMTTIDLIKGSVLGIQLAWEKSFFGGNDPVKVAEIQADLLEVKASLEETFNEAYDAGVGIGENFGAAIDEFSTLAEKTGEQFKQISIEATFADQERLTALRKQVQLAIAENDKLQFIYQREAELQRQIRDDVTLSIEDRIKANDELGVVLEKQLQLQEENALKAVELAQLELSTNKDNVDLQVALIEAEKNLADVRENVTGFRSEQLVNEQGLQLELIDLENSRTESEARRQLQQKQFEAERIGDPIAKLEQLKENLAAEEEIEITRLQNQIDRYKEGTQARQDAEQALLDFRQDIGQREVQLETEIANAKTVAAKKEVEDKKKLEAQKLAITAQTFGALATILGENSAAGKAAAIAQATINTYQGVTEVLANKSTLPQPFATIEKIASIATVLGTGMKTVREITSTPKPSIPGATGTRGGGGGSRPINGSVASAPATPPAFNVVGASVTSQLADTINNKEQQPVKAYVVSNEVTSAQSMDRNIVENATI